MLFTALPSVQTQRCVARLPALYGRGGAGCSHLAILLAGGRILFFSKGMFAHVALEPQIGLCPILCLLWDRCKSSSSSAGEGRGENNPRLLRGAERSSVTRRLGEERGQSRTNRRYHGAGRPGQGSPPLATLPAKHRAGLLPSPILRDCRGARGCQCAQCPKKSRKIPRPRHGAELTRASVLFLH